MGKKSYKCLFLITIMGLVACGGSGTNTTTEQTDDPSTIFTQDSTIFAQDIVRSVWVTNTNINLKHSVTSTNTNDRLRLDNVKSIEGNDSQCENTKIKTDVLSFTIENVTKSGVCVYQYTVKNSDNKSATGSLVITLMEPENALINLAHTTNNENFKLGESRSITLDIREDMTLSSEISIIGSGTVTEVDIINNTLTYQAGSIDTDVGVSKIYYHSYNDESIQLGVINVTISDIDESSVNNPPTVTDFSYATKEDMIDGLRYTPIQLGEVLQLDLDDYVDDIEEPDSLQLVEVQAFNANVQLIKSDNDNHLSFDFSANSTGYYDVSYTVSDQNGGYSTGIVQIQVVGTYLDVIIETTTDVFTAPLTFMSVTKADLEFSSTAAEDDFPIGNGVKNVPLYTWAQANYICRIRGMVLPSREQWEFFEEQEGNPFVDDADLDTDSDSLNWPIKHVYFSSTTEVEDNNKVQVYNPESRNFSTVTKDTLGYMACVDYTPQSLKIDQLPYIVKGQETQLSLTLSTLGGMSLPYDKEVVWDHEAPNDSELDDVNDPIDVTTITEDGKVTIFGQGWLNIRATAVKDTTLTSNLDFYVTGNILNVNGADPTFNIDKDSSATSVCQETTVNDGELTDSGFVASIGEYGQQLIRLDNCNYDFSSGTETFYHFIPSEESFGNSQVLMTMPLTLQFSLTAGSYNIEADVKFADDIPDAASVRLKLISGGTSYVCIFHSDGRITGGSGTVSDSDFGNGWQHIKCDFTVSSDTTARLQITGSNTRHDDLLTSFYIDNISLLPNR